MKLYSTSFFGNVNCSFFEDGNGEIFASDGDLANGLGYVYGTAVLNLVLRNGHIEEGKHFVRKESDGKTVYFFNIEGIHEVSIASKSSKAEEFRLWAADTIKFLKEEKGKFPLGESTTTKITFKELLTKFKQYEDIYETLRHDISVDFINDRIEEGSSKLEELKEVKRNLNLMKNIEITVDGI